MTSLRDLWCLPVDAADPDGVDPVRRRGATLPADVSRALDGARERTGVPRWTADGPPALDPASAAALAAPARAHAEEPLPVARLVPYLRFVREGVRTDHEDAARRLGIRTGEAVLAALATGEGRWVDRAAEGLLLLCEATSWCWAAHEEAPGGDGGVLPDPDAPVVDLGAAQTLAVVTWADVALGAALDERVPGLRARLRREAARRALDPYLDRADWHWLHGRAHNWTGWIHQHLLAAALLLEDDRARRDRVVALGIAQLDRYLASFPADGGIDEGVAYFWNGAGRVLESLELLDAASGGRLGAGDVGRLPVLEALLRFPQRMDLGGGWVVSVADGPARPAPEQPWDLLHRWGRRLGDPSVVAQAAAHRGEGPPPVLPDLGLGRVLRAAGDADWAAARPGPPPLPATTWLPDLELLVVRERSGDPRGLALAAKGGHDAEAHNHLDVGSVIVALDGSPVIADLGQPTYTADTFTDRRYETWVLRSEWHALPTVRGHGQGVGREYRASAVRALGLPAEGTTGADRSRDGALRGLRLDLARAYPAEAGLVSWEREATLGAEEGGPVVRLRDRWQLGAAREEGPGDAVVLSLPLAGELLEHAPGRLRIRALSGAVAELRWDPALGEGDLERRAVEDPLLERSWGPTVHRLRLAPPTDPVTGTGLCEVTVRRAPST